MKPGGREDAHDLVFSRHNQGPLPAQASLQGRRAVDPSQPVAQTKGGWRARSRACCCVPPWLDLCHQADKPIRAIRLERYNREMQLFNDAVDEAVVKPVATGYHQSHPRPHSHRDQQFLAT